MASMDEAAERAAELHERAIALREGGDYAKAEAACREAVGLFESAGADEAANLANALIEHARLLELTDNPREAIVAAERAVELLQPMIPDAPPGQRRRADEDNAHDDAMDELVRLTVQGRLALAWAQRAVGELSSAEQSCRAAIALAEERLGEDELATAQALNTLGVIYKSLGRYADAEPLYRRAFAIVERTDPEGLDAATLLHNLGGIAHARGDFAAGEPPARRSVELRTALLGPDHPSTAADRAAWGALLEGLGRLDEAEAAYTQALRVFEQRLGQESLEVAFTLTNLGSVRHSLGDRVAAEAAYRRAIAIREKALAADHADLALTLHNLAVLLDEGATDDRQRAEAVRVAERAARIFEVALGADHPHTRDAAATVRRMKDR